MSAAWCARYIGTPYLDRGRSPRGLDCWGLVRLVMAEQFGLDVPAYDADYPSANNMAAVSELIQRETPGWQPVATAREGDLLVFRVGRFPCHVGVALGPVQMLHTLVGQNASIERITSPQWARRLVNILRHPGRL